jgi:hypothetical protein
MAPFQYLGWKPNLGHPVNDLFELGTDVRPDQTNFQSAAVKTVEASSNRVSPRDKMPPRRIGT